MDHSTPSTSPNVYVPIVDHFDLNVDLRGFSRHWHQANWAIVGKRFVDVAGAGLGLVILSPLLLAVAAIVRLSSRGPVLFKQVRMGMGGKTFVIYKFRTMVADAEQRLDAIEHLNESDGKVLFKMKCDPRVTGIGQLLRRTNLDELPQLLNVLRGEMSLVGPRPLQLRDSALLSQTDREGFAHRLLVPPGLTGLWQASDRSETGFAHMLQLDLEYIRRKSLWLDFYIIFKTILNATGSKAS